MIFQLRLGSSPQCIGFYGCQVLLALGLLLFSAASEPGMPGSRPGLKGQIGRLNLISVEAHSGCIRVRLAFFLASPIQLFSVERSLSFCRPLFPSWLKSILSPNFFFLLLKKKKTVNLKQKNSELSRKCIELELELLLTDEAKHSVPASVFYKSS